MIVNSESSQSEWLAWTGVETQWPCGFQALLEAHVYGEFRDPAGIAQTITRGTHFEVALGVDGTATAVALPSMIGTHGEVRFHRLTPALKGVDFINLSSYSAEIHDYYYSADAMRDAEIRRDIGTAFAGAVDIIADDVSYPGGNVGLVDAVNVRQGLDQLAGRGLADLPDVNMTLGPAVDQYRVVWNNAAGTFGLASQSGQTGAEVVALINTELGGTTWQQGGTGGGGGGTITSGSNVGTGGSLGIFKAASGVQLQFYGIRGTNGITAQLNASTNSIDYWLDLSFADARYVKAADLDDVAFTGAYSSLIGLPTLGALSAKNLLAFVDIAGTEIASLAEAQAGTAPNSLMTPQRTRDAILSQTIPSSRSVTGGNGLIGGGTLNTDRVLQIGTPSSVTGSSLNSVTADSHTHALVIDAGDVIPSGPSAIGAYSLCTHVSGAGVAQNGTVTGSVLRLAAFNLASGTTYNGSAQVTGTFKNMGGPTRSGGADTISLWVRIA